MSLEKLIAEVMGRILEGGAALSGDRIPQAMVAPLIKAFETTVLSGLDYRSAKPIGSTGKKKDSGDIDIGLDTELPLEQIATHIKSKGLELKVNKGLGEISVMFPFQDLRAQVDLMVGPESWTQWQYYGPSDTESKYKGVYVRGITNAIFQVVGGHSISPARGVFKKDDPEKKYSRDVGSVVQSINKVSSQPWQPSDFRQPFEQIWKKAQESFSPQDVQKIKEYFLGFVKSTKGQVPSEMGEGMAYDKVQPFSSPEKGAQVGQGNIGGARNRGVPGYPVPPSMKTTRGLDDDEGFTVLENEEKKHEGTFLGLEIPAGVAKRLAVPGGEDPSEMHITLLYKKGLTEKQMDRVERVFERVFKRYVPIKIRLEAVGKFEPSESSDWLVPIFAKVEDQTVIDLRKDFVDLLSEYDISPDDTFPDFKPHITLKYAEEGDEKSISLDEPIEFEITDYVFKRGSHINEAVNPAVNDNWKKLENIVKQMGYRILPMNAAHFGEGIAQIDPEKKVVLINKEAKDPDRIFAVAHELGHILDSDSPEKIKRGLWLAQLDSPSQSQAKEFLNNERNAWRRGEEILNQIGVKDLAGYKARRDRMMALNTKNIRGRIDFSVNEAVDPSELQKGIPHLDDLKPEQFLAFLKRYADEPLQLEISEKVDGSARVSFGVSPSGVWTQSKNGPKKMSADEYPDAPMYRALKHAHLALESKAQLIASSWPAGVSFMVAEVLYTRIPNSIEYGPNVLMIHGVESEQGPLNDVQAKQAADQIIKAAGGQLSDGKEPWKFEYKRTISLQDVMVDVRKEYDTLGELYKDLVSKPRDKDLKAKFQSIQKSVKEKLVKMLHTQQSAYGPPGGDVEGLVFRDLETGEMVKLVDKDYFTKLNEFLWHYRKMLDAGGKVGGAWKTGVMQSFRKVVAEKVLGDPSASSTMLVKNLVSISQGVTGKTPEERADKTLAKYIKSKNLMSGDFTKEFQGALAGAFEDLNRLQDEWDTFKSSPQQMTFAGKTRDFPPEHVQRTEEAFQSAEAALRGIKAGMEVAAGIKHPLTQRVALMKLFMGHKFDKLVNALGGQEGAVDEGIGSWTRGVAAAAMLGAPGMSDSDRYPPEPPAAVQPAEPTIDDLINASAKRHGVPAELIRAMIEVESTGDPMAVSHKGAQGLMQLMPATAKWLGVKDPHDPAQNIDGGAKYIKKLIRSFNGNLDRVLAAYNFGPNAVRRTPKDKLPKETRDYIRKVRAILGNRPLKLRESFFDPGPSYPPPDDMPPGFARSLARTFQDKLNKRGIKIGAKLGMGAFGVAFDAGNGKVLKITGDSDEARSSMYLKGKQLKHVAHIFDVFRFPPLPGDPNQYDEQGNQRGRPFFGIVLEKLKVAEDSFDLSSAMMEFTYSAGEALMDPSMSWEQLCQYVRQLYRNSPEKAPPGAQDIDETIRILNDIQLGEMRDELLRNNVKFKDFHPGNIGQRADGTWVVFDLGSESQSPAIGNPPVLEGGPIDRMTGPTDLSGVPIKPENPNTLESVVYESVRKLVESQQGTIGITIGRFQPFHAGHATIIRQLCQKFSSVLVFVAGQKQDKKNPFSHDLRVKMMEQSLPDVWSKVKVFPASIQGKGTGYIPGLIANAAASGQAEVPDQGAVAVLVGEDRLQDIQKQVQHNSQHQNEPGYYTGVISVEALPGVKNDDDAGRISGTRVREAIAKDDRQAVMKMLDPHLAQGPEAASVYEELKRQLGPQQLAREIVERIISEMTPGMDNGYGNTRGGSHGTSGWSRAILAKDMTGDEMFQQMLRSPSTRMLPLNYQGTPNVDLPGFDSLNQRPDDEQDASKPTDLGEIVKNTLKKIVKK